MVILLNNLHPKKANSSIFVTDSGIEILVKHVSLNASFPISVTEFGITVLAKPCIRRFVLVSMMPLQFSRESYTLLPSVTTILVRAPHPQRTFSPIVFTESGMVMLVNAELSPNLVW